MVSRSSRARVHGGRAGGVDFDGRDGGLAYVGRDRSRGDRPVFVVDVDRGGNVREVFEGGAADAKLRNDGRRRFVDAEDAATAPRAPE